jgi:uncharacterized membrane protein YgcG
MKYESPLLVFFCLPRTLHARARAHLKPFTNKNSNVIDSFLKLTAADARQGDMKKFETDLSSQHDILVCTNDLARGVNIDTVQTVVNLDLPVRRQGGGGGGGGRGGGWGGGGGGGGGASKVRHSNAHPRGHKFRALCVCGPFGVGG